MLPFWFHSLRPKSCTPSSPDFECCFDLPLKVLFNLALDQQVIERFSFFWQLKYCLNLTRLQQVIPIAMKVTDWIGSSVDFMPSFAALELTIALWPWTESTPVTCSEQKYSLLLQLQVMHDQELWLNWFLWQSTQVAEYATMQLGIKYTTDKFCNKTMSSFLHTLLLTVHHKLISLSYL